MTPDSGKKVNTGREYLKRRLDMSHGSEKRRPSGKSAAAKEGRYANFFQIGHNEFEFLIEFGQHDLGIHTRIYVSPQHARALSDLLAEALHQQDLEFREKAATPKPRLT